MNKAKQEWEDVLQFDLLLLLLLVKYNARWPVTVSYFPPVSSLDVRLIFVLLAHNVNFVLKFFMYSFFHVFLPFPLIIVNIIITGFIFNYLSYLHIFQMHTNTLRFLYLMHLDVHLLNIVLHRHIHFARRISLHGNQSISQSVNQSINHCSEVKSIGCMFCSFLLFFLIIHV
jgi:hypothetical protein